MDLTFKDGRKCLHCGEPIADTAHGSQKFCDRIILPDGSIKSCKDDYHYAKRKRENYQYLRIAAHQKMIHKNIKALKNLLGDVVTLHDLNMYRIDLFRPVKFSLEADGKINCHFVGYLIKQINSKKFKIVKDDTLY